MIPHHQQYPAQRRIRVEQVALTVVAFVILISLAQWFALRAVEQVQRQHTIEAKGSNWK